MVGDDGRLFTSFGIFKQAVFDVVRVEAVALKWVLFGRVKGSLLRCLLLCLLVKPGRSSVAWASPIAGCIL